MPDQVAIVIEEGLLGTFPPLLWPCLCSHWKSTRELDAVNYLAHEASHPPLIPVVPSLIPPRPASQPARLEAPQFCSALSHCTRTLAQARHAIEQGHEQLPTLLRLPPHPLAPQPISPRQPQATAPTARHSSRQRASIAHAKRAFFQHGRLLK